jgi:hypothetical protein
MVIGVKVAVDSLELGRRDAEELGRDVEVDADLHRPSDRRMAQNVRRHVIEAGVLRRMRKCLARL